MKMLRLWFVFFILTDALVTAVYIEFFQEPQMHSALQSLMLLLTSLIGLFGLFRRKPFYMVPAVIHDWVNTAFYISAHSEESKLVVGRLLWSILYTLVVVLMCREFSYREKSL